ncbi:molting protein mlt-4 [Anaeramoeba flamelloides]|uniref:Molting protein mlt-4 n=1 Tax=Anaeramoeba flamelloides TaxID=1746091 RepID=A0AAV7YI31_9EUKA|nr:molting protein mlt-4 [Anaeramoeba flamelloides]
MTNCLGKYSIAIENIKDKKKQLVLKILEYRILFQKFKQSKNKKSKQLYSIHFFDINKVISKDSLHITIETKKQTISIYSKDSNQILQLITKQLYTFSFGFTKHIFPTIIIQPFIHHEKFWKTFSLTNKRENDGSNNHFQMDFLQIYQGYCDYYNIERNFQFVMKYKKIALNKKKPYVFNFNKLLGFLNGSNTKKKSKTKLNTYKQFKAIFKTLKCYGHFTSILCHNFDFKFLPKLFADLTEGNIQITKIKMTGIGSSEFFLEFAKALKDNINIPLEHLNLSNNHLGDKIGLKIINSLSKSTKGLRVLKMKNCNFTNKGVEKMFQILKSCKKINKIIKKIDFSNNSLGEIGTKAVTDWVHRLTTSENKIHSIHLSECSLKLNTFLPILTKQICYQLQNLDLSGSKLDNSSSILLSKIIKQSFVLRYLNLSKTCVARNDFQLITSTIKKNKKIEKFFFNASSNNFELEEANIIAENLINSTKIKSLVIEDNNFTIAGLQIIIRELISNKSIRHISLARTFRTCDNLKLLSELFQILIKKNEYLHHLNLEGYDKTNCLSKYIHKMLLSLGDNKHLQSLNIFNNEIGEVGLNLLLNSLKQNTTLTSLQFDDKRGDYTIKSLESITNMLQVNDILKFFPVPINLIKKISKKKTLELVLNFQNEIEKKIKNNKKNSKIRIKKNKFELNKKYKIFLKKNQKMSNNNNNNEKTGNSEILDHKNRQNNGKQANESNGRHIDIPDKNYLIRSDDELVESTSIETMCNELKTQLGFKSRNNKQRSSSCTRIELSKHIQKKQLKKFEKIIKKNIELDTYTKNINSKSFDINLKLSSLSSSAPKNSSPLNINSLLQTNLYPETNNNPNIASSTFVTNSSSKTTAIETTTATTTATTTTTTKRDTDSSKSKKKSSLIFPNKKYLRRITRSKTIYTPSIPFFKNRGRSSTILSNPNSKNEFLTSTSILNSENNDTTKSKTEYEGDELKFIEMSSKLKTLLKNENFDEIKKMIRKKIKRKNSKRKNKKKENTNVLKSKKNYIGHCDYILGDIDADPNGGRDTFYLNFENNSTLLHYACQYGNLDFLMFCLNFPNIEKIINFQDKLGLTPLHKLMSKNPGRELVMLLSDYGCDFNITDKRGWNALQLFLHSIDNDREDMEACNKNIEILNILLDNNSLINQKDEKGWTSVHRTANLGYSKLLEILIQKGGKVDQLDNKKSSALHRSARNGNVECVKVLIKYGADLDAVDSSGNTAMSLARLFGQSKVEKELDPNLKENEGQIPITFDYEENYLHLKNKIMEYSPNYYEYTILLFGAVKCGKTKLIQRIKTKLFSETYLPTIENKNSLKVIYSNKRVIINLLDVSGDQIYSSFREGWIKKADGFIIGYSVDENPEYLDTLKVVYKMIKLIKSQKNKKLVDRNQINKTQNKELDLPLILVSLKNDLKKKLITEEDGVELSKYFHCPFVQVSSKLNVNVEFVFKNLIHQLIMKIPNREPKTELDNPLKQQNNKFLNKNYNHLFPNLNNSNIINHNNNNNNNNHNNNNDNNNDNNNNNINNNDNIKNYLKKKMNQSNSQPTNKRKNLTEIKSFEDVLKNDICLDWFSKFLKHEYAQENLTFFFSIQQYKKINHNSPQLVQISAQKIAETYIFDGSQEQININFEERKTIENILESKQNIDSKLFDQALIQILQILKTDSYPKFIQTSFYKKMNQQIYKLQYY